jgi:hypothetical protein
MTKNGLVVLLVLPVLLLSACSPDAATDTISTAVAQTVSAQETQRAAVTVTPPVPSATAAAAAATITPTVAKPPPTIPAGGSSSPCARASWLGDAPPDGKIMKPGEQFWKTWTIQNTSTCTWTTSYQIIYWDGDLMGGATYYNFPQTVLPGQSVEVPLLLTAPLADGKYTSEWKFKTPDGALFGVGEYSVPISAVIEVSASAKPNYGITAVDYTITRDPEYGCPANVLYTIAATITTNGPLEITYYWEQWDGNDSNPKTLEMTAAGTKTVSRSDMRGLATTGGEKWMKLILVSPEFPTDKATYLHACNQ